MAISQPALRYDANHLTGCVIARPDSAARLDALSERDFPWYVRLVFAYQKRKYGQVLSPMWAWRGLCSRNTALRC